MVKQTKKIIEVINKNLDIINELIDTSYQLDISLILLCIIGIIIMFFIFV
jgi:hypothetical protein